MKNNPFLRTGEWLDQRTEGHFHEFRIPREAMIEMLEAYANVCIQPWKSALAMQENYSDAADEEIEELQKTNRALREKR